MMESGIGLYTIGLGREPHNVKDKEINWSERFINQKTKHTHIMLRTFGIDS